MNGIVRMRLAKEAVLLRHECVADLMHLLQRLEVDRAGVFGVLTRIWSLAAAL